MGDVSQGVRERKNVWFALTFFFVLFFFIQVLYTLQ